jgi:hypothetical protein
MTKLQFFMRMYRMWYAWQGVTAQAEIHAAKPSEVIEPDFSAHDAGASTFFLKLDNGQGLYVANTDVERFTHEAKTAMERDIRGNMVWGLDQGLVTEAMAKAYLSEVFGDAA